MAETTNTTEKKGSNYDIFKLDALKRFLTYEQMPLIKRLNLEYDDEYIYVPFCSRKYRISRNEPRMDWTTFETTSKTTDERSTNPSIWKEADSNAVLTICDLLCHTEKPFVLSGTYTTLAGLNRVKAGSSTTKLGETFYASIERYYDGKAEKMAEVCESLGGIAMGKGDVAYRIPLFGEMALQISFYESDDEFPAQMTFFLDKDICDFLFFETLWYMIGLILEIMKEKMEEV